MSPVIRTFIIGALCSTSCTSSNNKLCKDDVFFCDERSRWSEQSKKLTASQIMHLIKIHYSITGEGSESLEKEFARRGNTSVNILIGEIDSISNQTMLVSLAYYFRDTSNINLCSKNYKPKIIQQLKEVSIFRRNTARNTLNLFMVYCDKL